MHGNGQGFIQPIVKQKCSSSSLEDQDHGRFLALLAMLAGLLSGAYSRAPVHATNGSVHGEVYWVDQYNDMHPMAWAKVSADDGVSSITAYTTDGSYSMWLLPGCTL